MPLPSEASTDDTQTLRRPLCRQGKRADSSVFLSLQNLRSETQAHPRLAVLRQALGGEARAWHMASYRRASLPVPCSILGGIAGFDSKPICRMPANPLFASAARSAFGDTSVNAKQEGTP